MKAIMNWEMKRYHGLVNISVCFMQIDKTILWIIKSSLINKKQWHQQWSVIIDLRLVKHHKELLKRKIPKLKWEKDCLIMIISFKEADNIKVNMKNKLWRNRMLIRMKDVHLNQRYWIRNSIIRNRLQMKIQRCKENYYKINLKSCSSRQRRRREERIRN